MQVPILCTCELRQKESHLVWVCGRHGREPSPLPGPGLHTQDEMPQLTLLNPFPQQGQRRSFPCHSQGVLSNDGTKKGDSHAQNFSS